MSITWIDMLLRLLLAAGLSMVIGYNREKLRKPAGIRTHLLVALGSACAMLISLEMLMEYSQVASNIDPGRIAGQVITGIGFIGAGTIIRGQDELVKGLTTAASVWAVAGIGLACGAGFYLLAIMVTAVVLASLTIVNILLNYQKKKRLHKKD